jgi:hypothetical protein
MESAPEKFLSVKDGNRARALARFTVESIED